MAYDLFSGLVIKEIGTLHVGVDGIAYVQVLIGAPAELVNMTLGDAAAVRPFLIEQLNTPRPAIGLEDYIFVFKDRVFWAQLNKLTEWEKSAVFHLVTQFVNGGPRHEIVVDLTPQEDRPRRFRVIPGGSEDDAATE